MISGCCSTLKLRGTAACALGSGHLCQLAVLGLVLDVVIAMSGSRRCLFCLSEINGLSALMLLGLAHTAYQEPSSCYALLL